MKFYHHTIHFHRSRLSRMQVIMVIATITGPTSGMAVVLLKTLVHHLQLWIQEMPVSDFAFLLFPAIVLLITIVIVNVFFGGAIEKGITMVLKAIVRRSSFIPLNHTYLHVVTSSVKVGLEAPIVATGSAIVQMCRGLVN